MMTTCGFEDIMRWFTSMMFRVSSGRIFGSLWIRGGVFLKGAIDVNCGRCRKMCQLGVMVATNKN